MIIFGEPSSTMVALTAPANMGRRKRNSPSTISCPITSLAIAPPSKPAARPTISFAQVVEVATMSSAFCARATSAMTCAQRSATGAASAGWSATSTGANFAASSAIASRFSPSTNAVMSSDNARAKPKAAPLPERRAVPSCSIKTSIFTQPPPFRAILRGGCWRFQLFRNGVGC